MPISVELSTGEEILLYSEDPFKDVRVTLTNKEGNPGAIKAKIIVVDTDGQRETLGAGTSSNPLINPNQSWTSIKIASSYAKFEVWAEASEHNGKYSILCDVQ